MSASGLSVRTVVGLHRGRPTTPPLTASQRGGSPRPTISMNAISPCLASESCIFISLPGRKLPYPPLETGIGLRVELSLFLRPSIHLLLLLFSSNKNASGGRTPRIRILLNHLSFISQTCDWHSNYIFSLPLSFLCHRVIATLIVFAPSTFICVLILRRCYCTYHFHRAKHCMFCGSWRSSPNRIASLKI